MRLVIDASVALKWVFAETGSDAALALRSLELTAPAIWLAEAANALWRRARIGDLTIDEACEGLSDLQDAPVATVGIEPLLERALRTAADIGHPIYDCIYLVLAIEQQTHVITADRRFVAAAGRAGHEGRVRLLGEDPPPTRRRRRRGEPSR